MSESDAQTCTSCNNGTLEEGVTNATVDADGTTVVIRNVPAHICGSCGEGYFAPTTADRLLELAEAAAEWSGAPVQICDFE